MLHQGCINIGTGSTHSALSARYCLCDKSKRRTLLVGEGKTLCVDLKRETRGQIFNELIRHRTIDNEMKHNENKFAPVLLLAFDYHNVVIDLAFPYKEGRLVNNGWVQYKDKAGSNSQQESFWTVPIADLSISDVTKIPVLLKFLHLALNFLKNLPKNRSGRVQYKTPWILDHEFVPVGGERLGINVSKIVMEGGATKVFKEFCYHLRRGSHHETFNVVKDNVVEDEDQRKPLLTDHFKSKS